MSGFNKHDALVEEVLRSSGVNPRKCMRCGKCTATCPAFDEMEYHPHQFVYMVERGEIEKLMASPSIYKCLSCFACLERCPRQVEPVKLVEAVRLAVESQKVATSLLQRRLSIGYGRAAKLIDRMEEMGIVSPAEGNKPRRVLITAEQYAARMANEGGFTDDTDDYV